MPSTKEIDEKLVQEAMEREGIAPRRRGPDMRNPTERLRAASVLLGQALDSADKANAMARSAMSMFMAEWTAVLESGGNPAVPAQQSEAASRLGEKLHRPKTFNQNTPQHAPPAEPEKDDGPTTTA